VPKFNKGDRVRVRLTSHSPYRGQIGVVDDNPSSYSHPSTGSSELWYLVRFDYKGLHPAVRLMEEDLEAITDEIAREETPAPVKLSRRSRREIRNQITQVSSKRKYYLITLIAVLALTGILVTLNVTGIKDNSPVPPEFSSATTKTPLLTGGSSNETMKLAFATELVGAAAGSAFPIQPAVKIIDANGDIMTTSTAPVTLTVTNGMAELYGTTTVKAVNGVATFTNLAIILAGSNYSLTAISPGLTSSLSNSFNVGPGAGVILDFITEPVASGLASRFSVQVAIRDAFGNIDANSTAEVTLSITPGSGEPGAILSGTTTQKAENGVATFNYLSIDPEKSNYKLTATSPGLISTTSHSFNVAKITENQASQ
jgi:hypothetical protein